MITLSDKVTFTNQDLRRMVVPLFLEQLLTIFIGVADTSVGQGGTFVLSCLFAICFNMGVTGIALAMSFDWSIRGIVFSCACVEENGLSEK